MSTPAWFDKVSTDFRKAADTNNARQNLSRNVVIGSVSPAPGNPTTFSGESYLGPRYGVNTGFKSTLFPTIESLGKRPERLLWGRQASKNQRMDDIKSWDARASKIRSQQANLAKARAGGDFNQIVKDTQRGKIEKPSVMPNKKYSILPFTWSETVMGKTNTIIDRNMNPQGKGPLLQQSGKPSIENVVNNAKTVYDNTVGKIPGLPGLPDITINIPKFSLPKFQGPSFPDFEKPLTDAVNAVKLFGFGIFILAVLMITKKGKK